MDFSEQQIKTLKTVVTQIVKDESRETRDLLRQEMKGFEIKFDQKLGRTKEEILQELQVQKQEILEGVAEIIDDAILPRLDDHEQRLTRLAARPA